MQPDVIFNVLFKKDSNYLASPTVVAEYGCEVSIEIPGVMRAVVLAKAPDAQGRSFTSAKMAGPKEMTMEAYLSLTHSFEYSVPDSPYRFVVMPRRVVPVSPDSQYLAVGETTRETTWKFK
jgi:hypothetical protein